MAKDQFGTAVEVPNGWAVPQVIEIQPSHAASFDEAKTKVTTDAKTDRTRQMASDATSKIQAQIKSGPADLAALAKLGGADVKTSDKLLRGGNIAEFGQISERDAEIFTSLMPGKVGTPVTLGFKTLVFALKEREAFDVDAMKKALPDVRKSLLPAKRDRYFKAYIDELEKKMRDSKAIVSYDSVIAQIADRIQ